MWISHGTDLFWRYIQKQVRHQRLPPHHPRTNLWLMECPPVLKTAAQELGALVRWLYTVTGDLIISALGPFSTLDPFGLCHFAGRVLLALYAGRVLAGCVFLARHDLCRSRLKRDAGPIGQVESWLRHTNNNKTDHSRRKCACSHMRARVRARTNCQYFAPHLVHPPASNHV